MDLQPLWETFSSFTINQTFDGHQLDHLFRPPTFPQPFNLVGSTSPGEVHSTSLNRVHGRRLQLYNLFGCTPPPPTMSRYNQPRLRLQTGLRLGPQAPDNHRKPLFIRGTRHQPRAPDHRLSHETWDFYWMGFRHWYEMFRYLYRSFSLRLGGARSLTSVLCRHHNEYGGSRHKNWSYFVPPTSCLHQDVIIFHHLTSPSSNSILGLDIELWGGVICR